MRRSLAIASLVLLGAGAAAAWVWWSHAPRDEGGARTAPVAPAESGAGILRFPKGAPQLAFLATEAAVLDAEPLLEALPGRVAYDEDRTARVSAPLAGRVERIRVSLGDRVRQGDLLATVDAPEYAQAVADAKHDELEVTQKRQVHERARLLFDGGVMPRREFEAAETDLREAEVNLARSRRRLASLSQGAAGEAGALPVRAPLSGIVTERSINPGTQVGPDSDKPLFVISDPSSLRVVVDVPEQHLGVLRTGQHAWVEVDAYPGRRFDAEIVHVGDVLDAVTRRVQVRARVANGERLLKPEMFARVTPTAGSGRQRVRVPSGAIVTTGLKTHVFVERSPGEFERRQVRTASQGRDHVYLEDGVTAGERVVASGALLLESELQGR